ncbi:DUF2505 domain-containing protein [Lentzea flaviverrucosa]|uniref:DUF2505 domain-containing protein n=1 Tax=Lentzea flaviverrucosa TaxID=200379 RepID=A0A1H9P7S3_9PSEU|nr:DUF2505 domain-containing protein [Lentzea flaviverrucosa]RDI29949.1 uncharacterized protein DUF2505 [Lentzea flaviverrucosa]SER44137.1 Protein of unknown function [Lentzea flaviverrucosa]
MARRIEHHTTSPHSAEKVYGAMVDETYLRDRLAAIGGKDAQLVTYSSTGEKTSYQLKQGVPAEHVPSAVKAALGGDLVIQRTETWAAGAGTVEVAVGGVPGRLDGSFTVLDNGSGSKLTLSGEVKVSIPFLGGKIEKLIAEQVAVLLDKENEFTSQWLANRG